MTATKYGKYILRPARKGAAAASVAGTASALKPVVLEGSENWNGIHHRMKWTFVSAPVLMVDKPHTHDFDEILGFYSCNPAHELDFEAEIELSLGREGEKQVIKSPTLVCVPKGLIHCPLNVKAVGKPFLFVRIYLSPDYVRKPVA